MSRMTRIVPSTVLTVAALALAAPVAQAKPYAAPSGGAYANPSVQSTQDFNIYSTQRVHRDTGSAAVTTGSAVVTTGDTPLANPVQLPANLSAGLMHASTVQVPVDKIPTTPVNLPDESGNGFDWTAAAIGAGLVSILMLMLGAGVGFRRRGQLAA
jgi:hypothetical protein